jgi:hypothetical protein
LSSKPTISHREHFSVWLVCVYTCITVIDKVLLRKEVQTREYKYKKILRQRSILAVNFCSVTYFGVFNFGTLYLGAKIKPWPKFPDLRYTHTSQTEKCSRCEIVGLDDKREITGK